MLSYQHATHAGNHGDVLKHIVLVSVLQYMTSMEEGIRLVDTHAGVGGYSLDSPVSQRKREYENGIGRLFARTSRDLPPAVAEYVGLVRKFDGGDDGAALRRYPGSPALSMMLLRPQDQLCLYELSSAEHEILMSFVGDAESCECDVKVNLEDGFDGVKHEMDPPMDKLKGVVLIDPPWKDPRDYALTRKAVQDALVRCAGTTVMVWLAQDASNGVDMPQLLKETAEGVAEGARGWMHASLTVSDKGLEGSSVFVVNPPETLNGALKAALPWLSDVLAEGRSEHSLELSASYR